LHWLTACSLILAGIVASFGQSDGALAQTRQPPAPPPSDFSETLYGTVVHDPYRSFETLDEQTLAWIKREGDFTRATFASIPARRALLQRLNAFESVFTAVTSYQRARGRDFFLRRDPGADDLNLIERDGRAERMVVDIAAMRAADHGAPYAISFFLASPDGAKVAVGISKNGSEDAVLRVYDVRTGNPIGGEADRAQLGLLAWSDDSAVLYFNRLRALAPGQTPTDRYRYATVERWDLQSAPETFFDTKDAASAPAALGPTDIPNLTLSRASPIAALSFEDGADPDLAIWVAPKSELSASTAWRPLVSHADGVTAFQISSAHMFLLSDAGAPNFKVLELPADAPLSAARTLLPAQPDRIIESIHAAADGLYVVARRGLYATLLRVGPDGDVRRIPLPGRGAVSEVFADPAQAGVTVRFTSWTEHAREFSYDPVRGRFRDLGLTHEPPSWERPRVEDFEATARDGVRVPLTLISPVHPGSNSPVIVRVYGSYGISELPDFSVPAIEFVREGGRYAVCHVRGGGELGEAWRLAGKDASKPNTWHDLIACSEDLIAKGLADPRRLFIQGGSAGSIAVDRAAEERPDLFAGVIDMVPAPNISRFEFTPDGPLETQEFGSVKTEQGFRNLLAMDSYEHVRDGVRYPPFLITMGLHDPRVIAWQPAKLAARLLSSGNAALLRVDPEAGHGVGSTRTQYDELFADIDAFVFWRSGSPGWQPSREAEQAGSKLEADRVRWARSLPTGPFPKADIAAASGNRPSADKQSAALESVRSVSVPGQ
jgi:prolyl oligopeptidase